MISRGDAEARRSFGHARITRKAERSRSAYVNFDPAASVFSQDRPCVLKKIGRRAISF